MSNGTLTIDLNAVAANWRALNALSAQGVRTGAVVKADAYGLGAGRVAGTVMQLGVQDFFVATCEEGTNLRSTLGPGPIIYVFAGHMAGDTDMIFDMHLTPILNSLDQLTRHIESLPGHGFGVQLDTGMNRLGMEPGEWLAVRDIVLAANPALIMSHLACADDPTDPMNAAQLAVFRELTDGLNVTRSLAATGGILLGAEYHFNLTRPGVGMYGGLPFEAAIPVVNLALPVVQIRDVEPGETVGYANGWKAERPSRVATLAGGYADGLPRTLSGKATLFAGDTPCPLIGRVSMDLITVDITDLPEIPASLEILSTSQSVDDLAAVAQTIGYEILTGLGARYQRRYVGDAK